MNLFAFELGRVKDICFAELISVFGREKLVEQNLDTAIFEFKTDYLKSIAKSPQSLQNRLGGTIKIIEIIEKLPLSGKKIDNEEIQEVIKKILEKHFQNASGKIPFSLTLLSFKDPYAINSKSLLNFSKKIIKSLGLNSRFVNKGPESPKPSTIYKARVIEKGIDINIINGKNGIYIGKTVAIQDIDAYSERDFGKPLRDAKAGMLPPKLAQIMINFAPEAKTIYDPFCGTGTIPMEGILMGKNVIASDIEDKMIRFTKKNCEWLRKNFGNEIPEPLAIFRNDARFLLKKDFSVLPDAIVTEGYLGKPLMRSPSEKELEMTFREIENLYLNFLRSAKALLPENAKVVICVPAIRMGQKTAHLPHLDQLAIQSGFSIEDTFTYSRPDQIVAREIVVLQSTENQL